MKINSLLISALAGTLALASCVEIKDVAVINGTVSSKEVTEVHVVVPGTIDTLVTVTDGAFTLEVPTNLEAIGVIVAGDTQLPFVADGTPLNAVIGEQSEITSRYPKVSVNDRFNTFSFENTRLQTTLNTKMREIYGNAELDDAQKSEMIDAAFKEIEGQYIDFNKKYCQKNQDNIISLYALNNLFTTDLEAEEILKLIDGMSDLHKEDEFVKQILKVENAKINTAEGKPFVDFTVNHVYGYTKSSEPEPLTQEVKFSDYVGNGKYVLVDFWSPWCGPCKRAIPEVAKIYEKYHGENFNVLSVAVWEKEEQSVTIETAAELGIVWDQINNGGSEPAELYGILGIPHIMLVGPDGTILKRGIEPSQLEAVIAEYVTPAE